MYQGYRQISHLFHTKKQLKLTEIFEVDKMKWIFQVDHFESRRKEMIENRNFTSRDHSRLIIPHDFSWNSDNDFDNKNDVINDDVNSDVSNSNVHSDVSNTDSDCRINAYNSSNVNTNSILSRINTKIKYKILTKDNDLGNNNYLSTSVTGSTPMTTTLTSTLNPNA